jgi:hypothetical protein
MTGLLDIGDLTVKIPVRGVDVEVTGIGADGILYLLDKFPAIRSIFTGDTDGVTAEALMAMVPEAVGAIIAAGTGLPGNAEAEKRARALGLDEQVQLIDAIRAITFPRGIGPFVAMLNRLSAEADASGWAAGTRSLEPSKPA